MGEQSKVVLTSDEASMIEAVLMTEGKAPEPTEILCPLCDKWHAPTETGACPDFESADRINRKAFYPTGARIRIDPQPAWESRRIGTGGAWEYEIGKKETGNPVIDGAETDSEGRIL